MNWNDVKRARDDVTKTTSIGKMYFAALLVSCVLVLNPGASLARANRARAVIYPPMAIHTGPAWFEDVAAKAGIDVINVNGNVATKRYILEATGSGVAIFDYDNDGWPDIFLANGTHLNRDAGGADPTSHLFHNNHDGTFTDVTVNAGLADSGWGQGVCAGDYDNDGHEDLYVTAYGRNRLYHNRGNGTFKNVALEAGVAGSGKEWGTGCAFVDYDRDGKLDITVANYVHFDITKTPPPGEGPACLWQGTPVMCGPRGLPGATNILYHNLGGGKFEDVSQSGLYLGCSRFLH